MSKAHELEIEINGRVQGIMFRRIIKNKAQNLTLKGSVENKEDSYVKIIVQGEKQAILSFLIWLQSDPGFAKINALQYSWKNPSISYDRFTIIKTSPYIIDKAKSVINLGKYLIKKKQNKIPLHIAIIPDGNRRWAKQRGLDSTYGHYKSGNFENVESLIHEAQDLGVKYLTIWGFSTENWKRPEKEREAVFSVIEKIIGHFSQQSKENKIQFIHLGRKDRLPKSLINKITALEKETQSFNKFHVQLCLDYGGRDEIIRAVKKSQDKNIDENSLPRFLDTANIPDPDLIIRTGGERRLSGFLPFQSAYSELYFTDVFFPEFDAKALRKAVAEFSQRQRRFGE